MKMTLLFAALSFVAAGLVPASACDFHATHTTAAQNSTVVACAGGKCEAQTPAQQGSGGADAH